MELFAQVIISFATVPEIDKYFTYSVPSIYRDNIREGCRVFVPFGRGNKDQMAYVMHLTDVPPESKYKIKSITRLVEEPILLSRKQLDLATFLVEYYGCTYAAAIDLILPPGLEEKPFVYTPDSEVCLTYNKPVEQVNQYLFENSHKKAFEKQQWLLEMIGREESSKVNDLKRHPMFSTSSMQTLIKNEWIKKVVHIQTFQPSPINYQAFKKLNEEQDYAAKRIHETASQGLGDTILLQGVTGSGKTEVFLRAIVDVIQRGKSAIVLVPEIALTMQTLMRFRERFGNVVELTHSRMTPKERQKLYLRVRAGEVRIVIGPRSAVFMPFPNVGMIVIDEAHESTYKSETTPKYHAIEVARRRMKDEEGMVLLASATPSIESFAEFKEGKIERVLLQKRATGATLPDIQIVDLRKELREGHMSVISRALHQAIEETLRRGEQVMILLNRRGHSTFVSCRTCGFVKKCSYCDLAMTYHRGNEHLACHYCGAKEQVPKVCPECGSNHIRFFGNGTQKVEEYLNDYFSEYGIGRMDFDTTTGKEGHGKILEAFKNEQFKVLVGTQMIAKGHDFPNVTLVGIIAADSALYIQDFRSEERTYQLITQALGRAGRGAKKGRVIIQSYNPEHPVLRAVQTFKQEEFYEETLANRLSMGYPPYTHIFQILITGKNEQEVIHTAYLLGQYYAYYNKKKLFKILGPITATVGRVENAYRWKIIILGEAREKVLLYGKYCLNKFNVRENTGTIKIAWDIDPLTML